MPRKCKIKLAYKKKPAATPSPQAAAGGGSSLTGRSLVLLLMKVRASDAAVFRTATRPSCSLKIY